MRMRNTLIMALVALALLSAVYFLEIRGAAEREEAEAVAERLLRFESEEVTGLTIDRPGESIVLAKRDDAWRITAPYELAADETAVSGIINRLQGADHDRVVEEQPEELGRFGLDEPELTVTLQLGDGESRVLQFGDGTPVGFNVFVKRADDAPVLTVASGVKDAVDKTLFDLRNRGVLSFADADVSRIEIESGALDASVERAPDAGDGIDRWRLSTPLEAAADASTVSSLLQRLRTGNALAFAADAPSDEQLAEFGLDEPQATIRVWTAEDAAHTLQLGGAAEEPVGRYARRLGADAVMVVEENLVADLPGSVDELRNRTVVELARDRVDAIELTVTDAPTVRLEKEGVDWRILEPSPLDGDASTVAALLTAVLDLRAREFPGDSPDAARFGLGSPHARVSFELGPAPGTDPGEPEIVTLTVGATTEVEPESDGAAAGEEDEEAGPVAARYVAVDGQSTVFTVEASDLEGVLVDLFALRSKALVSFAQSDLTRLEITGPAVAHELIKNEDGQWAVGGEPVADSTSVDDMLWRLNYLEMQAVVVAADDAGGADLAAYGVDDPTFRVRAWIGEEMVADVGIGAPVPESELQDLPPFAARSQTFATTGDTGAVYRIDGALRDALQALVDAISRLP